MRYPMYEELLEKLSQIEKNTGIYLRDECIDAENAGENPSDWKLYDTALCAAEGRMSERGLNIHDFLKN